LPLIEARLHADAQLLRQRQEGSGHRALRNAKKIRGPARAMIPSVLKSPRLRRKIVSAPSRNLPQLHRLDVGHALAQARDEE